MNRIELDIWEPTRENPRMLAYVGQRIAQEVFKELKQRLESTGYLPDEYFLMGSEWEKGREIPKDADVFCTTDYGSSEGIYVDVYLKWFDETEQRSVTKSFATGKTLGESASDLDRMFLIASAITKAFHSDGVHARYIRLGKAEEPESTVIHLDVSERRLLIDCLVDKRNRLKDETLAVEQLLRRVTGSITEYVNEIGERPLKICDFDLAVISIHDGNLPAFRDAYPKIPDKIGELLIHAAARPGNVGREMTELLLAEAKDIPNDMYLDACKGAVATGDQKRILYLAERAATCVAELDMSLHGKLLIELILEHKTHIARALLEQCSPEQIKAADPYLMIMALKNWDYYMADKLAKHGIDANKYACEIIHELTNGRNDRSHFKYLLEQGMQIDNENYSAMLACVRTKSAETAMLLLDRGMDFDRYVEWAESQGHNSQGDETFSAIKEYWEKEIKRRAADNGPEPQKGSGENM